MELINVGEKVKIKTTTTESESGIPQDELNEMFDKEFVVDRYFGTDEDASYYLVGSDYNFSIRWLELC